MKSNFRHIFKVIMALALVIASLGAWQSAQALTKIVSVTFHFVDTDGNPVSLGKVSWKSKSGLSSSTGTKTTTALGYVTFPYVAEGLTEVSLASGRLADGTWVSSQWFDVDIKAGALELSVAHKPEIVQTLIRVQFPDGTPVPGAVVHLQSHYADDRWGNCDDGVASEFFAPTKEFLYSNSINYRGAYQNYIVNGRKSGCIVWGGLSEFTADANGDVKLSSYMSQWYIDLLSSYNTYATYADPEFSQTSENIHVIYGQENVITMGYMPFVTVLDAELDADKNAIVSIPVELGTPSAEPSFVRSISSAASMRQLRAAALSGPKVTVVPPQNSKQASCGAGKTKLSSNLSSLGKATLKVCANSSGQYLVKARGAVGAGAVTIHVNKTPPTQVLDLHAQSNDAQSIIVSWNEPEFDGGKPITSYVVTAKSKTKVISKNVKSGDDFTNRATLITGLKSDTVWSVFVVAKNSYGQSAAASTSVVVR